MSKLRDWFVEKGIEIPDAPVDVEELMQRVEGVWPHARTPVLCQCNGCVRVFREASIHLLLLVHEEETKIKKPYAYGASLNGQQEGERQDGPFRVRGLWQD